MIKNKNNNFVVKDAHGFKDSIACPETSVCVSVLGSKQSLYFSTFRKCSGIFDIFCIVNSYFEYRIRIRCIRLYIGAWFKNMFRVFSTFSKMPQKCE